MQSFAGQFNAEGQIVSPAKYVDLTVFKMASIRHLGFWKVSNFNCISVPNFMVIGQTVSKIRPFFHFLTMAAVHHLGFMKVWNFNGGHSSDRQYISSCQISCRSFKPFARYGHFSICLERRPFAILDLFYTILDHPQRAFGGLCHCAKFGWIQCSAFLIICKF